MKKQVVVIHGGTAFKTYEQYLRFLKRYEIDFDMYRTGKNDWKYSLKKSLGDEYEVILPTMPNKYLAKYPEWQIWFEKFTPYLEPEVILVGHSLGGLFLAKYLSENKYPKKVRGVFLVAAPFDSTPDESLEDFALPKSLKNFSKQAEKIFLYGSMDDKVVSHHELSKYSSALDNAVVKEFTDRGHFNQEEFPEIVEDIKSLG